MMNQKKSDPWTMNRFLAWVGLLAAGGAAWLGNVSPIIVVILALVGLVCGILGIKSPSRIIGIVAVVIAVIDVGLLLMNTPGLGGTSKPAGW